MNETHDEKKTAVAIYLSQSGGLGRWAKITPALNKHFKTIPGDPTTSELKAIIKLPSTYRKLRRLRQENPYLIVMINSFAVSNIGLGIISKFLGLPLFSRLRQGMWREVEDKWQFKPFPIKQLYSMLHNFSRRRLLSSAHGIIPVCYFSKNQLIYGTDIDFGKIMPVYNPINITAFDEAQEGNLKKKLEIPENGKIILTVTNFNYYKKYMGITYYLPAVLQALRENPGWYFVIAGGGYSFRKARKNIMGIVPEDMSNRVIFTGHYKPIEELFRDADIVVHLAFRDTAPNVVIEAQAAGKPVIVNYLGGMPELLQVRHDEPGCVIKEIPELYQSLTTLVNNRQLCETLGLENKQAIADRFTCEKIGDDLYSCITALLKRKTSSR